MISLVFGGSRGIGGIIAKTLEKRGDKVYVVSRKGSKFANNLKIDLLDENEISLKIKKFSSNKKINNIVFSQRYRGENQKDEFQVSVHSVESVINLLKKTNTCC